MIAALYELLTGRPYRTGRSAAADFGPPPGARYRRELAAYSDAELVRRDRDDILAEIRQSLAAEHKQVAGWAGVPGECGVECACGVTFDGFDTLAGAAALLDSHIANAVRAKPREGVRV